MTRRSWSVSILARNAGDVLLIRHKRLGTWLPVGGEVEADLGRFEWSVLGVVATFPRKTATERLEP